MQELEHYEWERRENYSEQPMMFPRQGVRKLKLLFHMIASLLFSKSSYFSKCFLIYLLFIFVSGNM